MKIAPRTLADKLLFEQQKFAVAYLVDQQATVQVVELMLKWLFAPRMFT